MTDLPVVERRSLDDPGASLFIRFDSGRGDEPLMGISTLAAGDMRLPPPENVNRERLLRHLGCDAARLKFAAQTHSRQVLPTDLSTVPGSTGDGLVSRDPRCVLSVTVADCLPVFLSSADTGAFGLVHSGWKGTGIAGRAVDLMIGEFGCDPRSIQACIGPGIGPCCYSVDEERAEAFGREHGTGVVRRGDSVRLDLRAANIRILAERGVERIRVIETCTSCSRFLGSFRREGPSGFTRMLAFIGYFG